MNKKGIFPVFFAIGVLIALIAIYLILSSKAQFIEKEVGSHQEFIFNSYEMLDKIDYYIKTSLGMTLSNEIKDFAFNGFYADCTQYGPFYSWSDEDGTCYPDKNSINEKLRFEIVDKFNIYLSHYEDFTLSRAVEHDFYIDGDELVYSPFNLERINLGKNKILFDSTTRTKLNVEYDYQKELELINERCSKKKDLNVLNKFELRDCVNEVIGELSNEDKTWSLCNDPKRYGSNTERKFLWCCPFRNLCIWQ